MKPIAVGGIAQEMVDDFPFSDENAGNLIHGTAPFEMFTGTVDVRRSGWRKYYTASTPIEFINNQCSHYIFSCANMIQFNNFTERKRDAYVSLMSSLDPVKVPLVIFGLGAQAPTIETIDPNGLPDEAIEFMQFLGQKCEQIGVRGQFTARVFAEVAGVHNTFVTGCPSFFQRPAAFPELKQFLNSRRRGGVSFNATHLSNRHEQAGMLRAIREQHFWLEVHSPDIHRFHIQSLREPELADVPAVLKSFIAGSNPNITRSELVQYFQSRYRLFRDARPWYQFNKEHVRFSYGTRFHGNMASLLAGRPALWLTHDSRTEELTAELNLPSLTITEAEKLSTEALEESFDFSPMFDNLDALYDRFNSYLELNGLPALLQD